MLQYSIRKRKFTEVLYIKSYLGEVPIMFGKSGSKLTSPLETCPVCGDKNVYPVERYQLNDMAWRVLLLCPDCHAKRELEIDRETVRDLLKIARTKRERLMKDLDEMQKKNMEEEVDKFITALNKDYVLPVDF